MIQFRQHKKKGEGGIKAKNQFNNFLYEDITLLVIQTLLNQKEDDCSIRVTMLVFAVLFQLLVMTEKTD